MSSARIFRSIFHSEFPHACVPVTPRQRCERTADEFLCLGLLCSQFSSPLSHYSLQIGGVFLQLWGEEGWGVDREWRGIVKGWGSTQ